MTLRNTTDNYDLIDMDEMEAVPTIKNLKTVKKPNKPKSNVVRKVEKPLELKMIEAAIEQDSFRFSYHASRHEYGWIVDSLREFYDQHWFEDILGKAKGGKEANVYICRAPEKIGKPLLAAKVYRPRMFRNLRKDHLYREGRENLDVNGKVVLDERAYHAMQKRSAYGLELLHTSWVGHEFLTMQVLYDGGVDLPRPYASSNNAIMMDYIGDEFNAAPALNEINLTPTEAKPLFQRVLHNIELMLACNRVHADLSAYNILYWEGEITLIDFPQAINPEENHNAWRIFARDVQRVCDYFKAQGVACDAQSLASKMWKSKGRATQPEIDPHFLDPEKDEDRRAWQGQKK
jgi:RIO kinase 1